MKKSQYAKKPNRVIYTIAVALLSLFFRHVFKLRIYKHGVDNLKSPFVLLSNHICNIDFLVSALAVYPRRVNMVTAAIYFRNGYIRWLIKLMGCIPKEQFTPDVSAIKNMMAVVARGDNLAIFPAGQSSFIGESTYIDENIARLVKKLGVQVICVRIDGAHMAFPKWNMKQLRESKIEANVFPLFTPEELRALTPEEIYDRIVKQLYFDDYEWQRKNMLRGKQPRCAEGLELLLYKCPKCLSLYNTKAEGSRFYCAACGNAARMDEYGFLRPVSEGACIFETPTAWNRWQLAQCTDSLQDGFFVSEPVELLDVLSNNKRVKIGEGTARLDSKAFTYCGSCNGETVKWAVDCSLSAVFPHEKKTSFEFAYHSKLYGIAPRNPRAVFYFVQQKEAIYRKYYAGRY